MFSVRCKRQAFPQVDLGVPKMVRGVITQGARGGDAGGGAATENRAFVRKYKVAHSLNAKDWNFIMDSKFSLPKVGGESTRYVCALENKADGDAVIVFARS